jgi:hypothetical protein
MACGYDDEKDHSEPEERNVRTVSFRSDHFLRGLIFVEQMNDGMKITK